MSFTVFCCVIVAAALHATWNALAKSGADKHLNMTAVVLGHVPSALLILPFVPMPKPESWGYLVAGAALHFFYQVFLLTAYRIGDFTQVYPIARGIAPLLVAGISVILLGTSLSLMETIAIFIIGIGILSLSLTQQSDGGLNLKASVFAIGTGCFIAGYSLVDGLGARIAGTPYGYYAWLSLINGVVFLIYIGWTKPHVLRALPVKGRKTFLIGGTASFLAYSIVVWAFTQAPIALVTALRETSIVFALIIGVVFLNEKVNVSKLFSVFTTLIGAALLRFSKG